MISKVLKRAHPTDIFFSIKNLPEIKYHVCVIVSHRRDLALTEKQSISQAPLHQKYLTRISSLDLLHQNYFTTVTSIELLQQNYFTRHISLAILYNILINMICTRHSKAPACLLYILFRSVQTKVMFFIFWREGRRRNQKYIFILPYMVPFETHSKSPYLALLKSIYRALQSIQDIYSKLEVFFRK